MGIEKIKNKTLKVMVKILVLTIAAVLSAFNVKNLVNAGNLLPGGFTGITVLIQNIARTFFSIELPFAPIHIALNVVPIIIVFKYIGKQFTLYSVYAMLLMSVLTDVMPEVPITSDILLISIFGGIISGTVGILTLWTGGSTGGSDFISLYLSEKKGVDGWSYVLGMNIVILAIGGCLFGIDEALYSIIYQYVSTQFLRAFYHYYQKDTLFVITNKPDEVYEKIKATHHSATRIEGEGCYAGNRQNMLYSVVGRDEAKEIVKAIREVDEEAFVNVVLTQELIGNFYMPKR